LTFDNKVFKLKGMHQNNRGCHGYDYMVVGCELPMQSVPFTTNVVRSNPARTVLDTTLCDIVCQ